jgi:hypothetical protein
MCHAREKKDIYPRFWWGSPKKRDHNEDRDVDQRTGS